MGQNDSLCEFLRIDNGEMQRAMKEGRVMVSTTFVIPYPPAFQSWYRDRSSATRF